MIRANAPVGLSLVPSHITKYIHVVYVRQVLLNASMNIYLANRKLLEAVYITLRLSSIAFLCSGLYTGAVVNPSIMISLNHNNPPYLFEQYVDF
jgi:hypothetical protein